MEGRGGPLLPRGLLFAAGRALPRGLSRRALFRLSLSVSCGALPRFPGCGPLGGEFPHRRYRAAGAADPPGGRAAGLCRGGGAPPCQGTSGERCPSGGRGPGPGGRGQRRDAVPDPPEPDQPGGGLPPRPSGDPGHPLRRPGRGGGDQRGRVYAPGAREAGHPGEPAPSGGGIHLHGGELHVFPPPATGAGAGRQDGYPRCHHQRFPLLPGAPHRPAGGPRRL